MRAYSMDLRERVLRDRVSASWVRRLKQRRRETGEVAPRQQRYGRHPVLAPQLHTLAATYRAPWARRQSGDDLAGRETAGLYP